jgi:hypothetical protein
VTTGGRALGASLLAATVLLGACRSDAESTPPDTSGSPGDVDDTSSTSAVDDTSSTSAVDDLGSDPTLDTITDPASPATSTPDPGSDPGGSATSTPDPGSDPSGSGTTAPGTTVSRTTEPSASVEETVPADADELVLSDAFSDDGTAWAEDTWDVDVPGEATATVIDGVGIMETDGRGTHEWVRALAPGSTHDDVTLFARITPITSSEGTVFIGLHGDGEWRDAAPYLPQTGVAVEYGYSEIFEGEIVLIFFDGSEMLRVGPVLGPVLEDGESADIRFEAVDGRARVKIWPTGEDEPSGWDLEGQTASSDGGVVQISYRDSVKQSVSWDELILRLWP